MDEKSFSLSKNTILNKKYYFTNKLSKIEATELTIFKKTILASWIAVGWSSILTEAYNFHFQKQLLGSSSVS